MQNENRVPTSFKFNSVGNKSRAVQSELRTRNYETSAVEPRSNRRYCKHACDWWTLKGFAHAAALIIADKVWNPTVSVSSSKFSEKLCK